MLEILGRLFFDRSRIPQGRPRCMFPFFRSGRVRRVQRSMEAVILVFHPGIQLSERYRVPVTEQIEPLPPSNNPVNRT